MRTFWLVCLAFVGLSCNELQSFEGSFRGVVVGSDDPDCMPPEPCSFIRRGFPEATVIRVDDFVPPPSDRPIGTLTTEGYAAFSGDALRLIEPLQNDQLSLYDFPGADRINNYIFAVRPTEGLLSGRDAVVFVSLIDRDRVELRVVVGSGDPSRGDHFGFFVLERR